MGQYYSEPERGEHFALLPDIETFFVNAVEFLYFEPDTWHAERMLHDTALNLQGWYWWSCYPGCIPDSDPFGPFDTEAAALADAQRMGV